MRLLAHLYEHAGCLMAFALTAVCLVWLYRNPVYCKQDHIIETYWHQAPFVQQL